VVLDFGVAADLAADATTGGLAGTPAYMAPEQALGQVPTPLSDWYSVGVMLYETLTGELPFPGTAYEMLSAKQQPESVARLMAAEASELLKLSVALMNPIASARPGAAEILRGLRSEVEGVPLVARAAPPDVPAELIGRETHLRALMAAFDTSSVGRAVTVFLSGHSGVGKSALIRRFVDELRAVHPTAVVLRGRCHERELMPYKAVDGLIDQIARHLESLPSIEVARLLPRDVVLLARLFPVLLRVQEVERGRSRVVEPLDVQELRRRAAAVLRELLSALSERAPLVLVIDDLQWGDLDSGSLLLESLGLPYPPALLMLAAYRSEDASAPLVRTLRDALLEEARHRDVRTLAVGELTLEQARDLAIRELAAHPEIPPSRGSEIAMESGGNPFFVQELVHHTVAVGGPAQLHNVIRGRIDALPSSAQELLTAVAVSAQPLVPAVAGAILGYDVHAAMRVLRAARLMRVHEGEHGGELETYHDRIRESVREALDPAAVKSWHARLAKGWEQAGGRPETLVLHFLEAEDRSAATEYAALAGAAADEACAFDRAAHYYRLLLEITEPGAHPKWCERLGDALSNAGRGREAAAAYRRALIGAPGPKVIDLERRAAEQLIRAGHLAEARDVLATLLPKLGIRPARTEAGALAGVVVRRLLLGLRRAPVRDHPESELSSMELQRIDSLWAVGAPLSLIELARGNHLHLRAMGMVLRAGEPKRVVRALAGLACASAIGGSRHEARTQRFLAETKQLADRLADPTASARTMLAEGICHKVNGRWVLAREHLERAIGMLRLCSGVRWEIETARTLLHDTLFWMGDWKRVFDEIPARRREAEERGDLYSATHVAVRLAPIALLAADQPDRARAEAVAGMLRWPSRHFDLQHRFEVCSLIEADLYAGRALEAWDRLRAAWPKTRWIRYAFQNARIEMLFYRARVAVACSAAGQLSYVRAANRDASLLERERAPWANALASLVRACISSTRADAGAANASMLMAEQALRETAMTHYAAAAQYRRGQIVGGDEGHPIVASAAAWLADQGVMNVERMVGLLAPGFLPGASEEALRTVRNG